MTSWRFITADEKHSTELPDKLNKSYEIAKSWADGVAVPVKVADYTFTTDDDIPSGITDFAIGFDSTAGVILVSLPVIAGDILGRHLIAYKDDASANSLTVQRSGSDLIELATSVSTTTQFDKLHFVAVKLLLWLHWVD